MKKIFLIIFVMLLGFMFMPIVNAEEIPTEGVTYFLQYPDGSEDVKEDYDEAIAAAEEEKLIFTGQTDNNGQVVLEDIASEGTLRVVQEVPNGYSTDEREIIINLQEEKKVEFRNTHGLINPKTGFSILKILLVLVVVITCTILTKKKKKALLVIPLLLVAGFVSVKAEDDNLVIDVKDNLGRAQSGVTVKVYAKPIIDAAPAIKFDANGGTFVDGSSVLYLRIPYNNCSFSNAIAELPVEYIMFLLAFKDGYKIADDFNEEPSQVQNGDEITIRWETVENPDSLIIIHGNGGVYKYKGKSITQVKAYEESEATLVVFGTIYAFKNGTKKLADIALDSACENRLSTLSDSSQIYNNDSIEMFACWDLKPDGIYINDAIFLGKADNCYANYVSGNYSMYNNSINLNLENVYDNNNYIAMYEAHFQFKNINSNYMTFSALNVTSGSIRNPNNISEPIRKIEIVEDGQTIFSASGNDIAEVEHLTANPEEIVDKEYYIANETKQNQLIQIFSELYTNNCMLTTTFNSQSSKFKYDALPMFS